jgi:hypothetical protein
MSGTSSCPPPFTCPLCKTKVNDLETIFIGGPTAAIIAEQGIGITAAVFKEADAGASDYRTYPAGTKRHLMIEGEWASNEKGDWAWITTGSHHEEPIPGIKLTEASALTLKWCEGCGKGFAELVKSWLSSRSSERG